MEAGRGHGRCEPAEKREGIHVDGDGAVGEGLLERDADETVGAKISTEGQRAIYILWRLAHDSVLCFGPREGKLQSFVLFEEWLPGAKPLSRDEALGTLAERYFCSHGPATVADFAW